MEKRKIMDDNEIRVNGICALNETLGPAAICGFRFDFKKPDSHLKSFGVETLPDLSVHYADKNSDDRFDWSVCLAFY